MTDIQVGLRCIWIHVPRGGYGFGFRIPVTVRKILPLGRVSVQIDGRDTWTIVRRDRLEFPGDVGHVGLAAFEQKAGSDG